MSKETQENSAEDQSGENSGPIEDSQKKDEDLNRGIPHLDPSHPDFCWLV